ncbi:MAG: hypothetical protein N2C14_32340, partial [Planctomycetales bacterium]
MEIPEKSELIDAATESNIIRPFRFQLYRVSLVAAGLSNIAIAAAVGCFPHPFFQGMGMDVPGTRAIWACLGCIVGGYGFLYLYAARQPQVA